MFFEANSAAQRAQKNIKIYWYQCVYFDLTAWKLHTKVSNSVRHIRKNISVVNWIRLLPDPNLYIFSIKSNPTVQANFKHFLVKLYFRMTHLASNKPKINKSFTYLRHNWHVDCKFYRKKKKPDPNMNKNVLYTVGSTAKWENNTATFFLPAKWE